MQFTKDTFYITLRNRLATVNPSRIISWNGTTRPAIVVAENEAVVPVTPLPDAFYLEWGVAQAIPQQMGDCAIYSLECVISYHTLGSAESGIDRGRSLGSLDNDLLNITQRQPLPRSITRKRHRQLWARVSSGLRQHSARLSAAKPCGMKACRVEPPAFAWSARQL